MKNMSLSPSSHEPDLQDILISLRQRSFILITFVIIGLIFGILFVFLIPRKYEAQSFVQLNNTEQNWGLFQRNENPVSIMLPPAEAMVLSQVEALKSRDLSQLIVKDMDLANNATFWQGFYQPRQSKHITEIAVQHLANDFTIKPVGRSLVISIRYLHSNAVLSAKIVNRLVQLYQEQQLKQKLDQSNQTNEWLETRLHELEENVRSSAKAVEDYSAKQDLIDGEKAQLTSQQISEVSTQLMSARSDLAGLMAKKKQIALLIKRNIPLDSLATSQNIHMLKILKESEIRLLSDQAQLRTKYGNHHPKILASNAELGEIRNKKSRETHIITQNVTTSIKEIEAKIDLLEQSLKTLDDKRRRENYAAIGLKELQRDADANRSLYNTFLKTYKKSKIFFDIHQPDIKILSIAHTPLSPKGPSPVLVILFFMMISFIFGIIISLTQEAFEKYIRNPTQIKEATGLRNYATIPNLDKNNLYADYIFDHPDTSVSESIRHLAIRVLGSPEKKVICITSNYESEGKTVIAVWLAQMIARNDRKTLLIDANFQQPGIKSYFDKQFHQSIAQQIVSGSKEIISVSNKLDILSGVASSQEQLVKLSQTSTNQFMDALKKDYDHIIVDAGALTQAETILLAKASEFRFLAIRWDSLPVKQLQETIENCILDNIPIDGCILTYEKSNGSS